MDLSTVKRKLKRNEYKSADTFASDVRLIFENCYTYNPPDHSVVSLAKRLHEVRAGPSPPAGHGPTRPPPQIFEKLVVRMPPKRPGVDDVPDDDACAASAEPGGGGPPAPSAASSRRNSVSTINDEDTTDEEEGGAGAANEEDDADRETRMLVGTRDDTESEGEADEQDARQPGAAKRRRSSSRSTSPRRSSSRSPQKRERLS